MNLELGADIGNKTFDITTFNLVTGGATPNQKTWQRVDANKIRG